MRNLLCLLPAFLVFGCGGGGSGGSKSHSHEPPQVWSVIPDLDGDQVLGELHTDRFEVLDSGMAASPDEWVALAIYTNGGAEEQIVFYFDPFDQGLNGGLFEAKFYPPAIGTWSRQVYVFFAFADESGVSDYPPEISTFEVEDTPADPFAINPPQVLILSEQFAQDSGSMFGLHLGSGRIIDLGQEVILSEQELRIRIEYQPGTPDDTINISPRTPGLVPFSPKPEGVAIAFGEYRLQATWRTFTEGRVFEVLPKGLEHAEPVTLFEKYRLRSRVGLGCAIGTDSCHQPVWHIINTPDRKVIALNFPFSQSAQTVSDFVPHVKGAWGIDVVFHTGLSTFNTVYGRPIERAFPEIPSFQTVSQKELKATFEVD